LLYAFGGNMALNILMTIPALRRQGCRLLHQRTIRIALGLFLSLATVLAPQGPVGRMSPAIAGDWHLVFHDEFSGTKLDETKWSTTYPWGARTNSGNSELEYYADDAFQLTGGVLSIRADHRAMHGFKFTSGMITSYASFTTKYGYFEVRAKVPKGQGLWPTFWLAPKDLTWPPEIDIAETQGAITTVDHMSNHYMTARGPKQMHYEWHGPDLALGFHTYGLEWTPTAIVWYVDGLERFRTITNIPVKPMYMILNLAVGGTWVGPPATTTPFPSYFDIDYVRAYQR
jgi:beta-glucanase (GH16 family)